MNPEKDTPTIEDTLVDGPLGRLAVRSWSPATPDGRAPIILLHDSLGSVELWRGFPPALCQATGRRVIAYDRLGFGQSAPHPGKLAPDFVASESDRDFRALIGHLGISRFIVFGHSVGGGMAVHCAARFGDACVALITESAQAFVEDRTVAGIEEARELFREEAHFARLGRYHGDKARWVLDAWIGSWLHPDFASWSLEDVLPGVRSPALVIHGIEDEYGSARHPRMLAALSGGPVRLELMEDTRHVPHRERESAVLRMATEFLSPLP